MMGQPYGGFPKELQKIVLKDIEPLTERPGKLLPPEDLEGIKKHLIEKYHYEDKSEEVMAQKQSAMPCIRRYMKITANILKCIMM